MREGLIIRGSHEASISRAQLARSVGRYWSVVRLLPLVIAGTTVALATTSAVAAPAPTCFPAHSKTITASKTARVFQTRRGTYGCLFRYGQARRLDPSSTSRDVEVTAVKPFKFAGPYLAYPRLVSQGCGISTCDWTEVVVADLRPTRQLILHKHYAASDETLKEFRGPVDEGASAEAYVTDLVLLRTGVVGWIECEGYTIGPCFNDATPSEKRRTAVFAASPQRKSRVTLDEGPGVDKTSLTSTNTRFHWRNDGEPRSRTFR